MIKIDNVSYKYPTRTEYAIKNINLHIKKGEFILLTGSTGCGKTTLLKCLNGIIPHESAGELEGNVWIDNLDTREHPIRVLSQKVGLVFQNPDEQVFSTRVLDEVVFGLENLCFPREEIQKRVLWALEKVGMKEYIHNSTSALSGGQKQRVALASVMALKPDILVLDEPISQLDPKGAKEVLEVVKRLADEGITIILVEHRLHEVASWADRVVIMDRGKIALDIPADKIYENLDIFRKLGLRLPKKVDINLKNLKKQEKIQLLPRTSTSERKLIEISNLWFSYDQKSKKKCKDWTLKGIDLDIYEGEMVGILGNNGSGKSTLMHHIAGLFKPQKGSITIDGKNTKKYNAFKLAGTVGILFQNPALMLTCDNVYDEIAFGPKNLKFSKEELNRTVSRCLELMELEDLTGYHPQTLSGGQRLRCAASSILSMKPKIILLDEPTSGQDILHIRKLMNLCVELSRKGTTVIFITHDFEVALEYTDRLIYMEDGNITDDIPTKCITHSKQTLPAI